MSEAWCERRAGDGGRTSETCGGWWEGGSAGEEAEVTAWVGTGYLEKINMKWIKESKLGGEVVSDFWMEGKKSKRKMSI